MWWGKRCHRAPAPQTAARPPSDRSASDAANGRARARDAEHAPDASPRDLPLLARFQLNRRRTTVDRVVRADEQQPLVAERRADPSERDVQLPGKRRLNAVVDGGEARAAGENPIVSA